MSASTASTTRSLRLSTLVRSAIITYGIAAYSLLLSWGGASVQPRESALAALARLFAIGLGLQGLLLLVRWLVTRYERRRGLEGQLMPLALYTFELLVDGVTVLLFALATFRGIFATTANF